MSRTKQPGIGIYVISSLLSNVPLMFLVLALSFEPSALTLYHNLLQIVFSLAMFGGAAVSSYFVTSRFVSRSDILGLVIGSFSYAIYFVYGLFFYQGYAIVGGFWPLIAFVLGGLLGARVSQMVRKRRPSLPSTQ